MIDYALHLFEAALLNKRTYPQVYARAMNLFDEAAKTTQMQLLEDVTSVLRKTNRNHETGHGMNNAEAMNWFDEG